MELKIYTHDEAAALVEQFEDVLIANNISVPSPEDGERDPEDKLGLYGSVYSDLLDSVEARLKEIFNAVSVNAKNGIKIKIVTDEFSGTV